MFGSSRVSCCYCILGSQRDLLAAARCHENHGVYRQLVSLEFESTFPFQPGRWLGDLAPQLLDHELRGALACAKECARAREAAEDRIPERLLFSGGWPQTIPTAAEAFLLCDVRRTVARAVGIEIGYTEPDALIRRYEELFTKRRRDAECHAQVCSSGALRF